MRCAVVGASGYAGAELVRLLSGHPSVRGLGVVAEQSQGAPWEELHPAGRHLYAGRIASFDPDALAGSDAVFLALPHGRSAPAARALLGRVGCVIDLSGDLRLASASDYEAWYGAAHPCPELLGTAVYGLPELFAGELRGARLIACAGCYATAIQLAAAPALGLAGVEPRVTAAGLSGTTGAGRKADLALSFSEVTGNLRAYRVGRHPHAAEIAAGLGRAAGGDVAVSFVPYLVPIARGILATVTLRCPRETSESELLGAYRRAYAGRPFVRVASGERLPEVRDVVGTNFCDLAPGLDRFAGTIVVVSVLDNLGKGAAGQAVQVFNLAFGLPETEGLLPGACREHEESVHG